MTIQKLKILANCLSAVAVIIFLGVVLILYAQPSIVNKVGESAISVYQRSYVSDAKSVFTELAQNRTVGAERLLQTKKWKNVLLDDKAYYLKREVLRSLCSVFRKEKENKKLLYWVSEWREIDHRDVDAMAYWYEALSHTIDRRQEGLKGISEGRKQFPTNIQFQKFYFQSISKSAEIISDVNFIKEQNLIIQNSLKGWELRWRWKLKHVTFEPIAELQGHFKELNFGEFWNALLKITRLLTAWVVNESTDDKGFKSFNIFPDKDSWIRIKVEIPRHMTTLRIDFPPYFYGVISHFSLSIDGVLVPVSDELLETKYVKSERKMIISNGSEDARFELNISSLDKPGHAELMTAEIMFKLHIRDILDYPTLVSHKLALGSLTSRD